jgi:alpha-beta hydrolase superfamily lysophospholipase
VNTQEFRLISADGREFHCYRWSDGATRAIVQIVHGAAEHAGRYVRFASELVERGFAVFAEDHRGHGRTATSAAALGDMGPANAIERVVDDVATLATHARAAMPGIPAVLFGHSMGSLIAQRVLARHGGQYRAAVLTGTLSIDILAQSKALIDEAARLQGRDTPAEQLQTAMFSALMREIENPRTPFDWLSRDPAEVDRYMADPFCGFALCHGAWQDIAEAAPLTADPRELRKIAPELRVLIASGAADPVHLNGSGIEQLFERYGAAGLRHVARRLYPGARHELLNELNREEFTRDTIAWMEHALGAGA